MILVDDKLLPQFRRATHARGLWVSSMAEHVFPIFDGKMTRSSYRTGPAILELGEGSSWPDGVGHMSLAT
jgi:hypothetical protein